jgi:hypothetical protein
MELDDILTRRALRLKADLMENGRPKASFLSTIYPAMDYGSNSPPVLKTPAAIPGFNDAEGEPDFEPEKPGKQVDEPGPTKTTSSSLPVTPGQSALVPDAHKKAAFELGYFGENRSSKFIERCVELITGVKKLEQEEPIASDEGAEGDDEEEESTDGDVVEDDRAQLSDVVKKLKAPKTSYG